MAKQTKKQKTLAQLDSEKLYTVDEAIATLREHKAKFDETVELSINLGVDPRHADQMVRGMISLPAGTGKDAKVAVFARGDNADKATAAGAEVAQLGERQICLILKVPGSIPGLGSLALCPGDQRG